MIFLPPLSRARLKKCRDASVLWGIAKGARVVVACPGPSLQNHIEDLRRADVIVSALRAAPLVKTVSRIPDIVVAAGFRGYFVPPNLPRSIYVIDLRTHPAVADRLSGPRLVSPTNWDAALDLPHPWICGASTALAALDTAALIGASSILLAGWDILQSRPGTPGRLWHRAWLRNFVRRFPDVKLARARAGIRKNLSVEMRKKVLNVPRPLSWIHRLNGLSRSPDRWDPFWGPDYSLLDLPGDVARKISERQRQEKIKVAGMFRSLGYT